MQAAFHSEDICSNSGGIFILQYLMFGFSNSLRCIKYAPFFVLCGSNFDLIFLPIYAIIVLGKNEVCSASCELPSCLTTSLTIDTLGAYGNNGYKTAKEHFSCSRNRYKKPFAAERAKLILFGMLRSRVRITSLRPTR